MVTGSLPGYCWSTNPTKRGFNLGKMAETFNKLMQLLGYPQYVSQGGDWGSLVARRLGQLYPDNCKAIHVNMLFSVGTPKFSQGPLIWLKWVTLIGPALVYDKREIEHLRMFQKFRDAETAYQVRNTILSVHCGIRGCGMLMRMAC
jgi:pimeloyl-ACP methyl ester carboxylesterase